jgi:hypothetical protein
MDKLDVSVAPRPEVPIEKVPCEDFLAFQVRVEFSTNICIFVQLCP